MGIQSDTHASYKLLARELATIYGYTVSEQTIDGNTVVTFTSPEGNQWVTSASKIVYPFTSKLLSRLSTDKNAATKYVKVENVNVPGTLKIYHDSYELDKIEKFIQKYQKVIVKPLDRSLSLGLTTDISTVEKVKKAIKHAAQYSDALLIQQQVFGEEIRFTVLNGKVVAALLRQTPRVVGDGVSTIQELIDEDNINRCDTVYSLVPYPQIIKEMIRSNLDLTLVAKEGEVVELSRATMISKGCSVYDVLESVDESYLQIVESLVRTLKTNFIVVDLFIEDYTVRANDKNYWFIEFNTSPVLKLFYSCRDANMHDILPGLAKAIHKSIHPMNKAIIGSFEPVTMPEFKVKKSMAKIDTGAYSGALGCSLIEVVGRGKNKLLRFSPGKSKKNERVYETTHFIQKKVRSSNGHLADRYLIETTVIIRDKTYPITIGLSDRSDMKHEILIGRKFLRENNLVVDVTVNQQYDTDREAK